MFRSELEKNIIQLVCKGLTNFQIGDELYYSEATIKKKLSTIYKRRKIKNRKELKNLFSRTF